jgi:hypothetical protein
MDWLFNIYHLLVDFFLIFVYFFQKLAGFLSQVFNLLIQPFKFLKSFITNINLNVEPANLSFYFPPLDNPFISFFIGFIFVMVFFSIIKRILKE